MSAKPSLLIVDDETSVTRTLQMIFELEGYKVHATYSAKDAIAALKNGARYDGVIADLNMERENIGLRVAQVANGLRPRPVVVICTGFANPENAREAMALRVDYLATKPVDPEELTATLRRLMQRRNEALKRKEGTW